LVDGEIRGTGLFRFARSYVDSAAPAEFDPAVFGELPVSAADRICMQLESPGQFAGARQALARLQIIAQNTEHDLGDQLFSDRDVTAARKPELHGGNIISCSQTAQK